MKGWLARGLAAALAGVAILAALQLLLGSRAALAVPSTPLVLLAPGWLRLLAVLPWIPLVASASLTDFSRGQRWLGGAVRVALVGALALALSRPSLSDSRSAVHAVALVDASDSISDRQLDQSVTQIAALRREAATAPSLRTLQVVAFAGRPRVVPLPEDPAAPLPAELRATLRSLAIGDGRGDATHLQAALQLAYGLYPSGVIRRALLLSDGRQTEGDLAVEAARAAARGVRLYATPASRSDDDEVLIRELGLPAAGSVRVGAPFTVEVELYASRPVTATIRLELNGRDNPLDGKRELLLPAGRTRLRFRSQVQQPGFATYRARIEGLPPEFHDRFADNNAALGSLPVRGRPRVLYVESEPGQAAPFERALAQASFDVELRGPVGLPNTVAELERFDLVVLSDVAAQLVSLAQMAALESYVRDLGGGFLMAGGESSFGSGGWGGTTVEKLLPVRFDTEKKRDQPQLALALAIDRSGSMQGEKIELAKDAARATAELLAPDDLLAVIAFDAQATPIVRLQRAANRLRIMADIARLQAGGGTNLLAPLQEAFQELAPARAKVKHVILLTDGQANYEGISQLVDEMAASRITVSAVGVGAGADRTLLAMIAERGGGRFHFTQDAQNVPKIFVKETTEVARSALVEEPLRARVAKRAELLDGVGIESAPPLRGYVATKAKPLSEVILVSEQGEPLLARSIMRHRALASSGATSWPLTVEVDPPRVRVAVDAVGADDRFVNDLDSQLEVLDPGARAGAPPLRRTPFVQTAPGRYEAELPFDRYGSFQLRAVHSQGGREVGESAGAVTVSYPREYLAGPPDETLLARAAAVTGGALRPTPRELFDPGADRVPYRRDLWPLPLFAAIALLVLDVALRRVRLLGFRGPGRRG